jgi:hypothetical protein
MLLTSTPPNTPAHTRASMTLPRRKSSSFFTPSTNKDEHQIMSTSTTDQQPKRRSTFLSFLHFTIPTKDRCASLDRKRIMSTRNVNANRLTMAFDMGHDVDGVQLCDTDVSDNKSKTDCDKNGG